MERFEELSGVPVHHFLKRHLFGNEACMETLTRLYEEKTPFFLYFKMEPGDMDIEQFIPILFCKYAFLFYKFVFLHQTIDLSLHSIDGFRMYLMYN